MRKNKKAQAVLPFFGLQLASVIVFLVVVLSLFLMRRNLIMFANEFNAQTENVLITRRLLSSSDCFAYEEQDMYFYNNHGQELILTGKRIYPYVLDANKLQDKIHFNCMRKDFFDTPSDAKQGIIDINTHGTGSASKYELFVYDITKGEYITASSQPDVNYTSSIIGYLDKKAVGCFWSGTCAMRYGTGTKCVEGWSWSLLWLDAKGVCVGDDDIRRVLGYQYHPITYLSTEYSEFTCTPDRNPRRSTFPIMLKTEEGFVPGTVHLRNCQISGLKYNSIPFCERSFKTTGEDAC